MGGFNMRYPQEIIEEVRSGNDIVDVVGSYVELKNRGGNFFGLCPFHNERTPSFSVNNDKQMYYCFGCGAGGNVISFIMQLENYDFLDALKFLADRINYLLPQPSQSPAAKEQLRTRDTLRAIHKRAAHFYYDTLQSDDIEAQNARRYLDDRGINPKLRTTFGLGLSLTHWDGLLKNLQKHGFNLSDMVESGLVRTSPQGRSYDRFRGRLMFPIMDIDSHVVGFGGRVMGEGEPKYLNSPETALFDKSRQLYGIHAARKARHKEIILVEGYMDVLSLHQAGYSQAVGILGTAFTAHHGRLLKRINCDSVVLLFDRDQAGVQAVLRAIPILTEAGFKVKCLQVTGDAKDPDEFLQMYGPARFGQLLEQAQSHVAFRIDLLTQKHDLDNTDQRIIFTQEAAGIMAGIDNAIESDAYIRETAKLTGISPQAIRTEMDKQRGAYFSLAPAPRDRPGLRYNLRGKTNERGLLDARKGMLSLLLTYPELSRKMQTFLLPEEMNDDISSRLLELAYQNGEKDLTASPAEIIAQFETLEDQRKIAELLKDSPYFDSNMAMEKAVNEMWKIIKGAWLKNRIAELEQINDEIDLNAINTLGKALRNLEKQYITITNG